MTNDGVSWMNGVSSLTGTIVTILLLVVPDRFSRKKFGYALAVPMMLSWLLIIFATTHIHLYVSKALSGISRACVFFLVPIYVSEITCDSIRVTLGSIIGSSFNLGILLGYILGGQMTLHTSAVVGVIVTALFVIAFTFLPESPIYLVRQNRTRDAIR